jgi:CheY-like chemotaxis protein
MSAETKPLILISDDEPMLVAAVAREARKIGLETLADTTSDVLALARKHQPEVILLDVRQRVDGRDLLSHLKKDPETRGLMVVMLSAVEDQFMRRVCLELGAEDYAIKPFDPSFMQKISRLAHATRREASAAPNSPPNFVHASQPARCASMRPFCSADTSPSR